MAKNWKDIKRKRNGGNAKPSADSKYEDAKIKWLKERRKQVISDCELLYGGMKTVGPGPILPIAFGWAHGYGWDDAVASLSYSLEMLNRYLYPKYGVKVVATQVKEKFGTLRFYYEVVSKAPLMYRFLSEAFAVMYRFVYGRGDFGMKCVVDKEPWNEERWTQITRKEYDSQTVPEFVANDFGWKFKEENGKYYRNGMLCHCAETHSEPTRHRFRHWLSVMLSKMIWRTDFSAMWRPSKAHDVAVRFADDIADRMVDDAKRICQGLCEDCGTPIGVEGSPRCRTNGRIRYVCEKCAAKSSYGFVKEK